MGWFTVQCLPFLLGALADRFGFDTGQVGMLGSAYQLAARHLGGRDGYGPPEWA
ncbi:hypothetical protein NVV93_17825 [Pseudomonas sp. LS44]|uniref:hypothetical protein n=1 Tax=Pseudomonas sp. LS44 TaxID=1357074 RepID=UPI00215A67B3|nr:hypothetical protein [Pseudomonas sp. LS44]UVE17405.1 hypothetical protein NVV93_17825 [Pseudomonas sp. LS44]